MSKEKYFECELSDVIVKITNKTDTKIAFIVEKIKFPIVLPLITPVNNPIKIKINGKIIITIPIGVKEQFLQPLKLDSLERGTVQPLRPLNLP